MFYSCPKCKNVWQYPIEKCPECFLKLKKTQSKNLKVIGVSKVLIPSPLHPKIPYFVLLLEDENKNEFILKSTKEYKIGDQFEFKKIKNKNGVVIWRVKYDLEETIEKVISFFGSLNLNQKKILILPTLVSASHPHLRENTHPEVLDELIKFLIKKRAKNIKVANQSLTEVSLEEMARKSRIFFICQKNKVEFFNLEKGGFRRIEKDNLVFEISEEVFKNDLIINLPILKIDSKLGVKGAMENLSRFWKKESFLGQKYLYQEEDLILKLKEVLPEILNIADGTIVQKSNKEAFISDLVLASFNPLNLDRVFAEIASISLPDYLKKIEIKEIEIAGRQIDEVKCDFERI